MVTQYKCFYHQLTAILMASVFYKRTTDILRMEFNGMIKLHLIILSLIKFETEYNTSLIRFMIIFITLSYHIKVPVLFYVSL